MAFDVSQFLSASELSVEAMSKEPKYKRLTALKNGVQIAVPVGGLIREEYTKRGESGEKGYRYVLTDANDVKYLIGENLARQIAKGLQEAQSKKRAGVVWKVSHNGKRVALGS